MSESQQWYEDHISEVADCWHSCANRLACSGIFPRFFVYYAPGSDDCYGSLLVLPEHETADCMWTVARPNALPPNATRNRVRAILWDVGRRLPLLKTA